MSALSRREFLRLLAMASAAGLALNGPAAAAASASGSAAHAANAADARFYDLPSFGNVSLLHFTDSHAQLLPVYFREPSVNLGVAGGFNRAPHLVGEALLKQFGIRPGTPQAHAFSYLDFERAAERYGKVGGFAHLATLVKKLRASRPASLLLDGGDTWQGSATALWTRGADMAEACQLLGVDIMTGHWEFTYGQQRVQELVQQLGGAGKSGAGGIEFLAQNVKTQDFGDPVFKPWTMRALGGVPVAVIGQAFPYTPIANPRWMMPDWSFGIEQQKLQSHIDEARAKGAQLVVLLSHNGMDVDLKLASQLRGLDVILGGHTHDGMPAPVVVSNPGGQTLVTNAGSNGKFLAVFDADVRGGRLRDWRYRLLPVFSRLLPADAAMSALIERVRAPYRERLDEPLAQSDGLLYRRGNFNGSFDQLILDALMQVKDAEIAFSPGFRWGTSLLPGATIRMEHLMDQTAITYPAVTLNQFSGEMIKTILEDVADNLFNPDPYYQQGGDMVRVGGLRYAIDPLARAGSRISDLRLNGVPLSADKQYKVAGWAPVAENVQGEPVWELVAGYLRARKRISAPQLNLPRVIGQRGNRGMA